VGIVRNLAGGGPIPITPAQAGTATVSPESASNVASTLAAANTARLGLEIQNPIGGDPTDNLLFVKKGAGVTLNDYSFVLAPGDYYVDEGVAIYTGEYTMLLNSVGPRTIFVTEEEA
jgi:hypothetical protein